MAEQSRRKRWLPLAGLLAAVALAGPGCGGSGSVTGNSGGGGSTRSTVDERGWQLDPFELLGVDIQITGTGSGTLDANVEWTFASDDVDVYVTAVACTTEMFISDRCAYKAKADSATTKPERVSFSVSAGDSYRFWIVNFGPQRESGTFGAYLTQTR
jgi:hypothetical protein